MLEYSLRKDPQSLGLPFLHHCPSLDAVNELVHATGFRTSLKKDAISMMALSELCKLFGASKSCW